ncbi:MAG: XdhC family protein [candidate division Zixibacteria bacterium]|nr:XdhC family protein [candidate division Zixibacteria bacterium]
MTERVSEKELISKLAELQQANIPCASVTVVATKGSTPRQAGSMMIVLNDKSIHGTIGGSKVEALLIDDAINVISSGIPLKTVYSISDDEGETTGMICGGEMEFFIQPFGDAPEFLIYGAGHCALPLCDLASTCGFSVRVFDERSDFANKERFPMAVETKAGDYHALIENFDWSKKPYVVILTHSHNHDARILGDIIKRDWTYLGMIGSSRKKKQVFDKLIADGIESSMLDKVSTPVGLNIDAETPAEIAVSIVAEMIKIRRNKC